MHAIVQEPASRIAFPSTVAGRVRFASARIAGPKIGCSVDARLAWSVLPTDKPHGHELFHRAAGALPAMQDGCRKTYGRLTTRNPE